MKKIILAVLILLRCLCMAQQPVEQVFRFGFSSGAEFQTLNLGLLAHRPGDPVLDTRRTGGAGASIGVWGAWQVLPALSVRPAMHITHASGALRFVWEDGQESEWRYPFTEIEVPVHFVLCNRFRRLPLQALILFGGRLSWNLSAAPDNPPVYLLAQRAGFDIGVGAGFRLGKWNIQPEMVYSYGLNNSHDFQNTRYDWTVGRILRDRLSIRLLFGRMKDD